MRTRWAIPACMALLACGAAAQQSKPVVMDRVVAIVGKSVILESDLNEEVRFSAFEPFTDVKDQNLRQAAMQRLIDRDLIRQQLKQQTTTAAVTVSDADVEKSLRQLRESLPACSDYHCATEDGWEKFCQAQGFTPQEVFRHWKLRMTLLAFIEQRFRTGIRITQPEIEDYYTKEFAPVFAQKGLKAPPVESVSERIQEILLQRRVNVLLDQWLQSLREQGEVQILNPMDMPASAVIENVEQELPPAPAPPTVKKAPGGDTK